MFKYLKEFFGPITVIRHPFLTLQKTLGIQEEWKEFKQILYPHRLKILFLGGFITYPLYQHWISEAKLSTLKTINNELQPGQPINVIVQSFVKQAIQEVLRDQQVQREAVQFVDRLGKQQNLQEAIVILLKDCLQNQAFQQEAQVFGKDLVLELLKDKEIEQHLIQLLLRAVNDAEVKYELKELFKYAAQQEDVKDAFVDLLKNTGEDQRFRAALGSSLSYALNEVLMRKETSERLRMFAYFLLESESKEDQGVKGLIDLIVQRALKRKTELSKESEFDRIMKGLVGKDGVNQFQSERIKENERSTQF